MSSSSPPPPPLLSLPPELIHQILFFLPPLSLPTCSLTCKLLHTLITTSTPLQYQLALTLSKASDNPSSLLPLSHKLKDLRAGENAWTRLSPRLITSVRVEHPTSGIYDLSGGTYLLGHADRKALEYMVLPTKESLSGGGEGEWRKLKVDRTIIDMGFCIFEHDLIAVLTTSVSNSTPPGHDTLYDIEMVLLEYSTGKPHPQAKESKILVMTSEYEKPAMMCEIVGDNLTLILTFLPARQPERIFIWNWRTNVLKCSFTTPCRTYSGFIVLSEDLILLPNAHQNTFDIIRIPATPTLAAPSPILTLALPSLASGISVSHITCRCEPNPIGRLSTLDKRTRAREREKAGMADTDPFAPKRGFLADPDEAIAIFQMRLRGGPLVLIQAGLNVQFEMGHTFTFFVHRRAFLDLVERWEGVVAPSAVGMVPDITVTPAPEADDDPLSTPRPVPHPWHTWGPPVSRWFNADTFPNRWITTSAGQRCVVIHEDARVEGSPVMVLDFNGWGVRRVRGRQREREKRRRGKGKDKDKGKEKKKKKDEAKRREEARLEELENLKAAERMLVDNLEAIMGGAFGDGDEDEDEEDDDDDDGPPPLMAPGPSGTTEPSGEGKAEGKGGQGDTSKKYEDGDDDDEDDDDDGPPPLMAPGPSGTGMDVDSGERGREDKGGSSSKGGGKEATKGKGKAKSKGNATGKSNAKGKSKSKHPTLTFIRPISPSMPGLEPITPPTNSENSSSSSSFRTAEDGSEGSWFTVDEDGEGADEVMDVDADADDGEGPSTGEGPVPASGYGAEFDALLARLNQEQEGAFGVYDEDEDDEDDEDGEDIDVDDEGVDEDIDEDEDYEDEDEADDDDDDDDDDYMEDDDSDMPALESVSSSDESVPPMLVINDNNGLHAYINSNSLSHTDPSGPSSSHHHHHHTHTHTRRRRRHRRAPSPSDPRHPGRTRTEWIDAPLRVDAPGTFSEVVEGYLPYVAYTSERNYDYDGVLLDEERVIGIRTDILDRVRSFDVLYFG